MTLNMTYGSPQVVAFRVTLDNRYRIYQASTLLPPSFVRRPRHCCPDA